MLGCSRDTPASALHENVPLTVAPAQVEARAPQCKSDGDCARMPSSVDETLLCEQGHCEGYDSQLALRWAALQVADLDKYQIDANPKLSDAPWYAEDQPVTLYARNDWLEAKPHSAFCVALTLQAHGGRLFGDINSKGHSVEQSPCSLRLSLSPTGVRIWDNRCQGGVPDENGGEERALFDRMLTSADARGLVFASLPVQLAPACQWTSFERDGCEPARCEVCTGYYLQTAVDYGSVHAGSAPKNVLQESLPGSCGPCLPDPRAQQVPRLAAIFARHRFTKVREDGAAELFVSQRGCENAHKTTP